MKMICMGIDISDNDVSCSDVLVDNINASLAEIVDDNIIFSRICNVTGDDITICSVINYDDSLEEVNARILDILKSNAWGFDDLNGIGCDCEHAGEGMSYAEIDLDENFYPDAVILSFDTYCGESFVADAALSAAKAACNMDAVGNIDCSVVDDIKQIPGVGYVSSSTDDPVVVVSVHDTNQVGVVAGAMIGAVLGNKNTYLVKNGSPTNVIPGSVIFTVCAIMNCNIIDLSIPFSYRMRILE